MNVNDHRKKSIYKVTITAFVVNLLLFIGKLLAGIFGRSGAMIADAVHSASDFATDLIVLLFVKVAAKPQDEKHKYGHGKFETLATVLIGGVLVVVGVGILINSTKLIMRVVDGEIIPQPGIVALIAAVVSITANESLFWYALRVGKNVNSPSCIANAWHHRSDALSSFAALIGIGCARFLGEQWRILDPIAAILVSALIIKVAVELIIPSISELVEKSLPKQDEEKILAMVMQESDIFEPHNLKTRRIGSNIAVELHFRVDPHKTVKESHQMTVNIEKRIKQQYGEGAQVILHVEPLK